MSIRSALSFLASAALIATVSAAPKGRHSYSEHSGCDLSSFSIPLDTGEASLPAPDSNLTLKWIGVTRATWNFTCDTSNSSAVATSIGTVGTFFDACGIIPELDSEEAFHDYVESLVNVSLSDIHLPVLGSIWSPTDHLDAYDLGSKAQFTADQTAIALIETDVDPRGPGSVALAWVQGTANAGGFGVTQTYRVKTAGGEPTDKSCADDAATFEVAYSAETWFYG